MSMQFSTDGQRVRHPRGAAWLGLLIVLVCLCAAVPAKATNDLLLAPAVKSDKATTSALMDVVNTGKRLVAVGEHGHILYSDDHGLSWDQAAVPTSVTLTAVDFPTAQLGWAVGHDGIVLHSSDGGASWETQLEGSRINDLLLTQVEQLYQDKKAQVVVANEDQKDVLELELEDLQFFVNDMKMAVKEGPTRPFMDVWFRNEREGIVVGSFGMILRTTDGGVTWAPILDRIDNPGGFHYYGIARSGNMLFLAGEGGMLFRSEDNGQNWARLDSPYEGSFFGVIGSPDGSLVVAFGLRGNAFRSIDGGRTWQLAKTSRRSALAGGAVFSDGSVYLIGNDGALIRSKDGGESFSLLPTRFPGGISVAEAGDGHLVLVGLGGVTRMVTSGLNK